MFDLWLQSLYNMLGEAYFKLERLKEAEHWYRQALSVKADHIPAHLTYGKLLTRIVISNSIQFNSIQSSSYRLQKRLTEAEDLFLRAKSLAPSDSTVYQHYGQLNSFAYN